MWLVGWLNICFFSSGSDLTSNSPATWVFPTCDSPVPLYTRFLHEHNIVTMTAYGRLKRAEVERCVKEYANHPFFNPDTDVLIDIEEDVAVGSSVAESLAQANQLLKMARQNGGKYFVAGVARNPEHEAILEALDERIDADFELKTFAELASAVHWLNLKRSGQ